jgi:C-terminal processing protease CtpA/Prc
MRAAQSTSTTLARWRTARRAILGAIVLAGSVVTSAAVMYRVGSRDCSTVHHRVDRAYTYSGIGVVIERHKGDVVVRRVLTGSPATDKLKPGQRLVSVDGQDPPSLESWAAAIRGAPGTTVDVTVAFPCGGQKVVTITRDVVRMAY